MTPEASVVEADVVLAAHEATRDLGVVVPAVEAEALRALGRLADCEELPKAVVRWLVSWGREGGAEAARLCSRARLEDLAHAESLADAREAFYRDGGAGDHPALFALECARLTQTAKALWTMVPGASWPARMGVVSSAQKRSNLHRCGEIGSKGSRASVAENRESIRIVLNCDERFISDCMDGQGVFEATRNFSNLACTRFHMVESEEFQAGRNAWAAFGLQLLFGQGQQQSQCTPAIAGYSLLYPLSDNYLDDPDIPLDAKLSFQARFRAWLTGDPNVEAQSAREALVRQCVHLIEESHGRSEHPYVWESMLAIHHAQTLSLGQHASAPTEDILELSVYKGGTSVLADMFLVRPVPERRAVAFAFHFGVALQFVDDLQDVYDDAKCNQQTLFTLELATGRLQDGAIVRKLAQYLAHLFDNSATTIVGQGVLSMCMQMVLKAIARASRNLSNQFLDEAEQYCALPMSAMKKLAGLKTLLKMIKEGRL